MIRFPTFLVVGATALALTACSPKAEPVPVGPADLNVVGVDIKFDQTAYTASAGEVSIKLENRGNQTHNLLIKQGDKKGARIGGKVVTGPGATKTGAYTLAAGTYYVYCDIAGHEASMNSTLTVS